MFNYRVIFSKRRSVALDLSYDNQITVRCPYYTSQREVERFVNSRKGWLEKHMVENVHSRRNNGDLLEYKTVLVGGKACALIIGGDNKIVDGEVHVKNIKCLKRLYIRCLGPKFAELFNKICLRTGMSANSVTFKDYKGRWGCCDASNNIIFNYKLLMLPQELRVYVIVHELCHTECHDHSAAFWKKVSGILGDCGPIVSKLKSYAFLARLY